MISDYENWRDSMHDRPRDDGWVVTYSHDYPNDTRLEFTRDESRAQIELSFTSEDPDCGTETLVYGADEGATRTELIAELRADITAYLDSQPCADRYYDEYTRTALYAFEAILLREEHE